LPALQFDAVAVTEELRRHPVSVAVATHDVLPAQEAFALLVESSTHCRLELLHGLPYRRGPSTRRMYPDKQNQESHLWPD